LLLERDSICDIMAKFELMTPPKSKEALHFVFQVPDDALPCLFLLSCCSRPWRVITITHTQSQKTWYIGVDVAQPTERTRGPDRQPSAVPPGTPIYYLLFIFKSAHFNAPDATQAIALVNSGKHPVTEGEVRT
jgi:hypothetical protein